MDIEIKSWLYDIITAIDEINSFTAAIPDVNYFESDIKTKRAVERNIEIIGEAVSRIINKDARIPLSNSRRIVDTRNRIIHGYDTVSNAIIWNIVKQYLPLLKQEIEHLLND